METDPHSTFFDKEGSKRLKVDIFALKFHSRLMKSINQMTYDSLSRSLHQDSVNFKSESVSTNIWAGEDFSKVSQDFAIYLTDLQTQGKGRDGRSWQQSQAGHCLLSTWCYRTQKVMQPIFSPLVGLALFTSLKSTWPNIAFALKAPNDIYVGEQKLAGILIEAQTGDDSKSQEVYVGIGLNIFSAPKVDRPTVALADFVDVHSSRWSHFLESFSESLKDATKSGAQSHLNDLQREKLLVALNAFPTANYSDISATGDLRTGDTITSWRDL